MNTLLLSGLSGVFLVVAVIRGLDKALNLFGIVTGPFTENVVELTMYNYICLPARRARKVRVERKVEDVMLSVFIPDGG